jgi:hypothetical protein
MWFVVEVAGDHDRGLWVLGEQAGDMRSDAGDLGGAPVQRVDGVPGPFVLVAWAEPAAGEGEQYRLQVDLDDLDGPAAGADLRP